MNGGASDARFRNRELCKCPPDSANGDSRTIRAIRDCETDR